MPTGPRIGDQYLVRMVDEVLALIDSRQQTGSSQFSCGKPMCHMRPIKGAAVRGQTRASWAYRPTANARPIAY